MTRVLFLIGLVTATLVQPSTAADPFIWPLPATFTVSPTMDLSVSNTFNITSTSSSIILQDAIHRYMDRIIFTHSPDTTPPTSSPSVTSLTVTTDSDDETLQFGIDESYVLTIQPNTATLTSKTIYGAMRGLETFAQSVTFNFSAGYYQTATSSITDAPRFGWRGLLIDTSRHYQSVRSIERVLESMAIAKLNVLHWHIVDTQSFPLTSRAYPKLQNGAFDAYQRFSLNDVADIVMFAQQRGIRVVPEFDVPGHTMSWCVGYPEICPNPSCNSPNGESDSPDGILNPANNFTYELMEGLWNEVGAVFTDEYLHIGGDETQTSCWDKTDDITSWMAQNDFDDNDALLYFNKRALDIVGQLDQKRRAVQWDEMFTLFADNISATETTIQVWHGADLIGDVVSAGFQGIFAPNAVWYLDHLGTNWERMYETEPAEYITDAAAEKLLLGGEGCMWGETVDVSDIEQTIWPRMGAIAERLWSPREVNDTAKAEPRYAYFRCLLNQRGVEAAPYNNSNARGAPSGPGSCYKQR